MIKKIYKILLLFFLFISCLVLINYSIVLSNFENGMLVTKSELASISNAFFKIDYNTTRCVSKINNTHSIDNCEIVVKLFNVIPVAIYNTNILLDDEVIVGGNAVGVSMQTDGVTIIGFSGVTSEKGIIYPFKNCDIKIGDRIKYLNGFEINTIDDIDNAINSNTNYGQELKYKIIRNEKIIDGVVSPVFDIVSKMYKLGIWIREDINGIGTLTFINKNTLRFGALGHGICDNGSEEPMNIKSGNLYCCDVLGVTKGLKGRTGEIKGIFTTNSNDEGVIDANNEYGVYGYVKSGSQFITSNTMKVGGRLSVKPGKATILCCLDGKSVKNYDIEIIKTSNQSKSNPKSIVVRVVDKELLDKTGGIIQGMSGSPIIQNNKIIGAITHVFVNDPTKGFGVYLDWMINQ